MDTDAAPDGVNSESAGIAGVGADRTPVAPALANGHEDGTSPSAPMANDNASTVVDAAVPSPPYADEHVASDGANITDIASVGAKADPTPVASARANDIDVPTSPPAPKANDNASTLAAEAVPLPLSMVGQAARDGFVPSSPSMDGHASLDGVNSSPEIANTAAVPLLPPLFSDVAPDGVKSDGINAARSRANDNNSIATAGTAGSGDRRVRGGRGGGGGASWHVKRKLLFIPIERS